MKLERKEFWRFVYFPHKALKSSGRKNRGFQRCESLPGFRCESSVYRHVFWKIYWLESRYVGRDD